MKDNTLFGLIDKEKQSIERIKFHAPNGKPYWLAFSGGKDSICIHKLAELADVEFTAHYNDTTVDPPELRKFIKSEYSSVKIHKPERSMFQLIIKKGPPMRNRRWCCSFLKENTPKNNIVITGIRHEESARRGKRGYWEQSTKEKTIWFLNPIIDWTELDVWEFIQKYNLKYPSLYDEGYDRIGCILCPMTRSYQSEAIRWPKMVNAWKVSLRRYWERKKKEGSAALDGWDDFEHFWRWWIDRDAKKRSLEQKDLFISD